MEMTGIRQVRMKWVVTVYEVIRVGESSRLAAIEKSVLGATVTSLLPGGQVRVRVYLRMPIDIIGRRIVWRIASDIIVTLALVDADVIDVHL